MEKHLNMVALPAGVSPSMLSWSWGSRMWMSVSGSLQLHLHRQKCMNKHIYLYYAVRHEVGGALQHLLSGPNACQLHHATQGTGPPAAEVSYLQADV